MKSTIDKLKAISQAFNSADNIEHFAVNLDLSLAGISVDEAERLYADQCRDIVRHMSSFWCEAGRFSFKKALMHFDSSNTYCHRINRFALPYGMQKMFDKDCGPVIAMYAVSPNGKNLVQTMSVDPVEDLAARHRIDISHEMFIQLMYDITYACGLRKDNDGH